MANKKLNGAKAAKKDEFYTQFEDIQNELRHYSAHFRGKTVLCNCDDPYESNFFKFFACKFNEWGIGKLICTCYDGSPVSGSELQLPFDSGSKDAPSHRHAYKVEITSVPDMNGDGAIDLQDVRLLLRSDRNVATPLRGNGDFRSAECEALLQEADIVVTNPPFSLFRQYVAQLMKHGKQFLIVGHQNALTYKEIFPLIRNNRVWLGYGFKGGAAHFASPYTDTAASANHRAGMIRVSGVVWFTNLNIRKRAEPLILCRSHTPACYPQYDNYNAINVNRTADIPANYDGVMGVPVTFLNKYCPEQFEIVWTTDRGGDGMLDDLKLP